MIKNTFRQNRSNIPSVIPVGIKITAPTQSRMMPNTTSTFVHISLTASFMSRKLFKNPCSQAELNKIVPFGFSLQRQKMVFFLEPPYSFKKSVRSVVRAGGPTPFIIEGEHLRRSCLIFMVVPTSYGGEFIDNIDNQTKIVLVQYIRRCVTLRRALTRRASSSSECRGSWSWMRLRPCSHNDSC